MKISSAIVLILSLFVANANAETDMYPTSAVQDGEIFTAKEYSEMLSTSLTFHMDQLFSENQTIHRKLIENLYSDELKGLGSDELVEKIKEKKEDRDAKRHERDRAAATMEGFKEEQISE